MSQLDFSVNVHFLESVQGLQHLLKNFQQMRDCPVTINLP